jgi:hypothetical protein
MPELRTKSINLWQPQPFGVGEDGNFVAITLPNTTSSSAATRIGQVCRLFAALIAMAALDPSVTLTLLDGKQVELAAWSRLADLFVGPDQVEACQALDYLADHGHPLRPPPSPRTDQSLPGTPALVFMSW